MKSLLCPRISAAWFERTKRRYNGGFLAFSVLLLAACGGSGNNGAGTTIASGVFIGSPVEGLPYRTATQSGLTDANGTFHYLPGESITFYIGDSVLGEATASETLTPFDLTGAERITESTAIADALSDGTSAFSATVNITRLLQTLDEDSDPRNGIVVSASSRDAFIGRELRFAQSGKAFANDTATLSVLRALERTIMKSEQARANMYGALSEVLTTDGKPLAHVQLVADDINVDGKADLIRLSRTFDDYGNVVGEEGNYNLIRYLIEYTYDAAGNRTSVQWDNDADGTADLIETYSYDAAGNRTRREVDSGGDGTADDIVTYAYDATGNRTCREVDRGGDGTADDIITYAYDAAGNMTRSERDEHADEVVDSITTYTYDTAGNRNRVETDSDADGIVDSIIAYDAGGNVTLVRANGITLIATDNATGNLARVELDNDGDGTADDIITYAYDAAGNRTVEERDSGADGTADDITTYTYDAAGNLTSEERDSNGDGSADDITTYTYDTAGNLTSETRDGDGDGTADFARYWHWEVGGRMDTPDIPPIAYY